MKFYLSFSITTEQITMKLLGQGAHWERLKKLNRVETLAPETQFPFSFTVFFIPPQWFRWFPWLLCEAPLHVLWYNFFYSYGNERWCQKVDGLWGCWLKQGEERGKIPFYKIIKIWIKKSVRWQGESGREYQWCESGRECEAVGIWEKSYCN